MSSPREVLEKYLHDNNLQNVVYPHQKDIIEWMYYRASKHLGSLNADAMGLGKTLDVCILLQIMLPRLALIICPTSCIYSQWVRNLCRYSIYYKVYVLKSNKIRQVAINNEGNIIKGQEISTLMLYQDPYPYKVIVSNFHAIVPYPGVAARDGMTGSKYEVSVSLDTYVPELTPLNDIIWDTVVVDEVHSIRNGVNTRLDPGEKRKKMLRYHRLSRLRMTPNIGIRIGLTGTPIQNRISDVVSILTFLGAKFSPRCSEEEVKKAIREYMFRRTEDNLHVALRSLINFPDIDYEEISKDVVYESQAEADVYRIVAGALTGETIPGGEMNPYSKVVYEDNPLVRTQMECYLSADINMFIKIHNDRFPARELPFWYGTESKMNMIVADIVNLSIENTSFICFIHFYSERAAILQKMYQRGMELGMGPTMGYTIFDINGDIDPEDRDYVIKETERMIAAGQKCICFITIQTGSDGLNLQHFYTVIFPTSDWNPAMELQAIKRTHRIGQKRLVRVYRYIHRYIIDAEDVKHIDLNKLDKQYTKKEKFTNFITNCPNAAYDWPIRDMPGFEGEKCVFFPEEVTNDFIDEMNEAYSSGIRYGDNSPDIRMPDPVFTENLLNGNGRKYKSGRLTDTDVSKLVNSFYEKARISNNSSNSIIGLRTLEDPIAPVFQNNIPNPLSGRYHDTKTEISQNNNFKPTTSINENIPIILPVTSSTSNEKPEKPNDPEIKNSRADFFEKLFKEQNKK